MVDRPDARVGQRRAQPGMKAARPGEDFCGEKTGHEQRAEYLTAVFHAHRLSPYEVEDKEEYSDAEA